MLNIITKKFRALLDGLKKAPPPEPLDTRFVDLAPTASADNAGIYFDALKSATTRDHVLNIALTGPYGSGKSSVIKTFLAQYQGHPLQLSLASFLPDGEKSEKLNTQEIERSILQQILYGVNADKLPYSRFKRIKVPKRMISIATSFVIMIGLVCAWYLFSKQAELASGKFFDPFSWFNYFSVVAVGVFVWKVAHSAYTNSLGLSLKSISLKDLQIAPAAVDQESILNRHLDEILYFFQSTDYDLVVIEDLDRFENPDIFVTLREINGLINANEGIKRRVRFLYALRDDIFANTDRTKFFEFIVPIVPVINHSNSVDKVIEHSQRIDLNEKLDKQFIREVSRYLSDLRLIQNIFNEYVVYAAKLTADDDGLLSEDKLLAILIYKNVMPKDFAALHRQEGMLSQILSRCDQHVSEVEHELRGEISSIKTSLAAGEQQELRDEAELRKVYAMAVVQRLPENFQHIISSEGELRLGQLTDDGVLEALIKKPKVTVSAQKGNYHPSRTSLDLSDLESSVDPTRSFEERKAEIRTKSVNVRSVFEKRIHELETKISSLRTRRFNEVVRESAKVIENIFGEIDENRDLLRYLILEGHIDDTYYQYISLFHSGRLSPKDNSFLIKIRAYSVPDPDFHLDNVDEVIASMRSGDFGQAYVLNRFIVDQLFADATANAGRIADALKFIMANFEDCSEFFSSYYAAGLHVENLVDALLLRWPGFVSAAVEATDGPAHIARILAVAPVAPHLMGHGLEELGALLTMQSPFPGGTLQIGIAERRPAVAINGEVLMVELVVGIVEIRVIGGMLLVGGLVLIFAFVFERHAIVEEPVGDAALLVALHHIAAGRVQSPLAVLVPIGLRAVPAAQHFPGIDGAQHVPVPREGSIAGDELLGDFGHHLALLALVDPWRQARLLTGDSADDGQPEGVEGLGGNALDPGDILQALGDALAKFLGRGRVEGEHQDLIGRGNTFTEHVAGLCHHGGGLAGAGRCNDHDVVVHADAGMHLFVSERVLLDAVEESLLGQLLAQQEGFVVLLDLGLYQIGRRGAADRIRPGRALPGRWRIDLGIFLSRTAGHPGRAIEFAGDELAPSFEI